MGFVAFFLILFGIGAALGLLYVLIRAIIMASRGSVWFAKEMKRTNSEAWAKAKAEHEAKKHVRAQP